MTKMDLNAFQARLQAGAETVDHELGRLLPKTDEVESVLFEAMRYAVLGGGKRIRPFLVMASSQIFNVAPEHASRVAAAVEMVHAYSLVHDDLPCMDDDEMRRGRPTVHVKYDEATAILVGDALLTLAFEVLSHEKTSADPNVRAELVLALARAAGAHGMVGGQVLDLLAEREDLDESQVVRLQRLKTGELIAMSAEAGAILGHAGRPHRHALRMFAHDLGLAFQITDDLLDVEGSAEEVGKAVGKDEGAGKATFVSLLGAEAARDRAGMLSQQAKSHLEMFGEKAEPLRALCDFVITRRS
jgi:farnesyl diphosphate synthase